MHLGVAYSPLHWTVPSTWHLLSYLTSSHLTVGIKRTTPFYKLTGLFGVSLLTPLSQRLQGDRPVGLCLLEPQQPFPTGGPVAPILLPKCDVREASEEVEEQCCANAQHHYCHRRGMDAGDLHRAVLCKSRHV